MNALSYITIARMPTEKAHGVSIAHMCAAFANIGNDVLLIIPTRKNHIKSDIFSYYGISKSFSVKTIAVPDFVGNGFSIPLFFFLQRIFFLEALRKTNVPPGIVYTREPEVAWKFSKTHQVVFEAHRWPRGLSGRFQAWLVRNTVLVVCNSHGTEVAARHSGVSRTLVAPNGFDPATFVRTSQRTRTELGLPEGICALYVGSDGEGKGADIVEKALSLVDPSVVRIVSILTARRHIESSRVPEYLLSADILLLPNTRRGESEYFTSPIKLFEYLGAGKAIIASDLPSIREILSDDDTFFVSPGSASALADAVMTLAKNPELRERLSRRAKALSSSYSWDQRASNIMHALT